MSQLLNVLSSKDPLPHFTHDKHPLIVVPNEYEFMCDGCNTPGAGERYHCKECQFDLHHECAVSPANLSSHIHPIHPLVRTWERPDIAAAFSGDRPCIVCGDQVNGLFFTCPVLSCSFFLHPLCSKVPESVHHVIDTQHSLTFQHANESECKICGHNCTGWRYRCGPCRIDIHLECLLSPPKKDHDLRSVNLESRGCSPPKSRRPLHQSPNHHQYPYKPEGGYGTPGSAVEMQSPLPSYGSYQYQPINNQGPHQKPEEGPHKPKERHDDSPEGSSTGGKRKKMYAILAQLLTAVVASTIVNIPSFIAN